MNLDISTTIKVVLGLIAIGIFFSLVMAVKSISAGRKLNFYQKRQTLIYQGWRMVLLAVVLVVIGLFVVKVGEPVVYKVFPPSPTITLTPTVTLTPTITLTPSQTYTPTVTQTLDKTYTPGIPSEVMATIQTPIGVDTTAIFSIVTFATSTKDGVVVDTQTIFTPPITHMYGGFSYDRMSAGVQWTAVWLYGNQVICSETKPWTYSQGGYGYTDCELPASSWKPGEYEVQIFVGTTWKNSGRFTIKGEGEELTQTAATPLPTLLPTDTPTPAP